MAQVPRGTVLAGRFTVGERIGAGATGCVYRGTDIERDQPVAIKVLVVPKQRPDEFVARFRRECRLMGDLCHPCVPQIFATGITERGEPFVAMELIDGTTLAEQVERHGPLAAPAIAAILRPLAECLDAAHGWGIIHRDIKPGNVVLAADRERVWLLDFGVAKIAASPDAVASVVTMAGLAVGTPEFMSPEQALGRPVDARSDIYSLGVTLYAALVGRLPFDAANPLQIMLAHVKGEIPPFVARNPTNQVPASVEAVVRRAMAKDPADRFATAGDLASAFANALTEPAKDPPPHSGDDAPSSTCNVEPPVEPVSISEVCAGADVQTWAEDDVSYRPLLWTACAAVILLGALALLGR